MTESAQKMPAIDETLWDAHDVAKFLKMSIHWVRKAAQGGKIPHVRIAGHSIRYEPEKIKAWAKGEEGGKVVSFKR